MIPIDTSRLDYIFRYTLSIMKNIGNYEIKLTCSYVSPVCLCLYNALKQAEHNSPVSSKSWPKQAFMSLTKFFTPKNVLLLFLPQTAHWRLDEETVVATKKIPTKNFKTVILTNFFFQFLLVFFLLLSIV